MFSTTSSYNPLYQNIFRGATFPATPTLYGFFRIFFNLRVFLAIVLPAFGSALIGVPFMTAMTKSGFSWVLRGIAATLTISITSLFLATNNYIAYFPHYLLAFNGALAQGYCIYITLRLVVWKNLILTSSISYMVNFANIIAKTGYTMMIARLRQDVMIDVRNTGQDVDYRVFYLIEIVSLVFPQFVYSIGGGINGGIMLALGASMWAVGKVIMMVYYYPHERKNITDYFYKDGENSPFLISRVTNSLSLRLLANMVNYLMIGLGIPYLAMSFAFSLEGVSFFFAIVGPIISVGFMALSFLLISVEVNKGESGYMNTRFGPVFRLLGFNFVLNYLIVVVPAPVDNVSPTVPTHFSFSPSTQLSIPLVRAFYFQVEFFSLFFLNLSGLSRATGFYTRYVFAFFLYSPGYLLLWAGMHAPMSFDIILYLFRGFVEGFLKFITSAQSFQIFSMICPNSRGSMISYQILNIAGWDLPDFSGAELVRQFQYESDVQVMFPGLDFETTPSPVLIGYFNVLGASIWYLYTFITIFASAVILLVLSYIDNDPFLSSPYCLYRVAVLMGLDQQDLLTNPRWVHLFGEYGFDSLTSHFSIGYPGSVLFNQIVSKGYGLGMVNLLNNTNPSELGEVELEVFNRFHRFGMTYYQAVEDLRETCIDILEVSESEYLMNTYNLVTAHCIKSDIVQFNGSRLSNSHIPELF